MGNYCFMGMPLQLGGWESSGDGKCESSQHGDKILKEIARKDLSGCKLKQQENNAFKKNNAFTLYFTTFRL